MFLAIAVLLIQPQFGSHFSFSAEKIALIQPANSETSSSPNAPTSNNSTGDDDSLPLPSEPPTLAALATPLEPAVAASSEALPDAPISHSLSTAGSMEFIKPGDSMTVSVRELNAENRRKQYLWKGLAIASSGAATFDAWSTRRAIAGSGAEELNPLLKPFAGNVSLYAAIQVGPVLLDYAGKKMMYSQHTWIRRMWWVPQSASFVSSIFCGAHNLSYR